MRWGLGICVALGGALLLAACENLSGLNNGAPADSGAAKTDGGSSDANATDDGAGAGTGDSGGLPIAACDLTKPFGPLVPVESVNTATEFEGAPTLTDDELTIIFTRTDQSILTATRAKRTDPFGPATSLATPLITGQGFSAVFNPAMTADGLLLLYGGVKTSGTPDIFAATRPTRQEPFDTPRKLPMNTNAGDFVACITADGSEMLISRNNMNDGNDPFRSKLVMGDYGTPTAVNELTGTSFFHCAFSRDKLTVFFGRDNTAMNYDVWSAHRSDVNGAWTSIGPVSELNTEFDEAPHWVSPGRLSSLPLEASRVANTLPHIFMATRPQ